MMNARLDRSLCKLIRIILKLPISSIMLIIPYRLNKDSILFYHYSSIIFIFEIKIKSFNWAKIGIADSLAMALVHPAKDSILYSFYQSFLYGWFQRLIYQTKTSPQVHVLEKYKLLDNSIFISRNTFVNNIFVFQHLTFKLK